MFTKQNSTFVTVCQILYLTTSKCISNFFNLIPSFNWKNIFSLYFNSYVYFCHFLLEISFSILNLFKIHKMFSVAWTILGWLLKSHRPLLPMTTKQNANHKHHQQTSSKPSHVRQYSHSLLKVKSTHNKLQD